MSFLHGRLLEDFATDLADGVGAHLAAVELEAGLGVQQVPLLLRQEPREAVREKVEKGHKILKIFFFNVTCFESSYFRRAPLCDSSYLSSQ